MPIIIDYSCSKGYEVDGETEDEYFYIEKPKDCPFKHEFCVDMELNDPSNKLKCRYLQLKTAPTVRVTPRKCTRKEIKEILTILITKEVVKKYALKRKRIRKSVVKKLKNGGK